MTWLWLVIWNWLSGALPRVLSEDLGQEQWVVWILLELLVGGQSWAQRLLGGGWKPPPLAMPIY